MIRAAHQSFYGAFAQQNPRAFLSFNRLLNVHSFDTIIEIGTHDGGLSTMFALYCCLSEQKAISVNPNEPILYKNQTHHRSPKKFWTFDIVERDLAATKGIERLHGSFVRRDTLNDETTIEDIRQLIEYGRSTLLLCDGGNKKKELELYGSSLKSGDFVALHDWARDEAHFESNKARDVWHGWETRWENGIGDTQQFGIKDLCDNYGIQQVYATEFDDSAWFVGCKI